MTNRCVATAFLLAVGIAVAAQQKPDFSGEWTLNRQASTLSPGAAAVRSGGLRIDHREPLFRYKATLVTDGKPFEYGYELSTDGREVPSTQQGRQAVSSLKWEGNALVFTGRIQGTADSETKVMFRYELIDGNRRLRAVEQVRGPGPEQDNLWIFERQ
jgi:hypothetical protein